MKPTMFAAVLLVVLVSPQAAFGNTDNIALDDGIGWHVGN